MMVKPLSSVAMLTPGGIGWVSPLVIDLLIKSSGQRYSEKGFGQIEFGRQGAERREGEHRTSNAGGRKARGRRSDFGSRNGKVLLHDWARLGTTGSQCRMKKAGSRRSE